VNSRKEGSASSGKEGEKQTEPRRRKSCRVLEGGEGLPERKEGKGKHGEEKAIP